MYNDWYIFHCTSLPCQNYSSTNDCFNHWLNLHWIDRLTFVSSVSLCTVRCRYNAVNFSYKYSQKTPHASHNRARYGMYFVDPATDWCSALAAVIIYVMPYNTGPCCGGAPLYLLVLLVLSSMTSVCVCLAHVTCADELFFVGWRKPVLL